MSGIASIGATSAAISKPLVRPAPITLQTPQSALATAAKEATETLATTRQEAAKGDPVAIRKLAQLEHAQKARQSFHVRGAPTSTPTATVKSDNDGDTAAADNSTNTPPAQSPTIASITQAFGLDAQA